MYYGLIILSVVMFGGNFALNDVYRRLRGSSLRISLEFSLVGAVVGVIFLFCINGFHLTTTPFTILMAFLSTLNGLAFTFCGFRALGLINLSLYSLFSMLGGMLLPFLQGILFFGEDFTLAKGVCLLFICAALLLTVEKGEKKKGTVYYVGIFLLNGLSGVISKLFVSAPFAKGSATDFSIWSAILSLALCGILLLAFFRKKEAPKNTPLSLGINALGSGINRVANLILVLALAHVDASVQYPMVTGGVMIVSTLLCYFGKNKPSPRELLSVSLAFLGMLALFVIPI